MTSTQHTLSLRCKAHWQNTPSQRFSQILPKSLPVHPTQTHGGQDSAANLRIKLDRNKNSQPLTSGHKTCRFQWVFERSVPPRRFVTGDTDAATQSGTFHTADRYAQLEQRD